MTMQKNGASQGYYHRFPVLSWLGIIFCFVLFPAGLLNLVSVSAVVFGVIFLDEHLTALQWAACGLVLLGVFISRRSPVTSQGE